MNEHAAELDKETQETLNTILRKQPHELTELDQATLRAREYYLKDKHKARYPEVFSGKPAEPKKNRGKKPADQPAKTEPTPEPQPVANLEHPADQDEDDTEYFDNNEDLDLDDDEDEALG